MIGIDFGTTKTLVTRINPTNDWPVPVRLGVGSDYIPTAVYIEDGGKIYFGEDADERVADNTGLYLRGFKMKLGSTTPLYMHFADDGRVVQLHAKDLVREYLLYIRKRIEENVFMEAGSVTRAVITRPVNFSPALLEELKEAAHEAGFTEVKLTTEPEAAGLAFCRMNAAKAFKRSALVVDWGGGTLDFALVTRDGDTIRTHPRLTDGDTTMGGEVFDELLWNYVMQVLRQQGISQLDPISAMPMIRRAKERLSTDTQVTLRLSHMGGVCPPIPLSRKFFNNLIIRYVESAAQKVQQLLRNIPQENRPEMLLLVGGSCRIPLIKETLEDICGLPAHSWEHSREAVGLGAALWQHTMPTPQTAITPAPQTTTTPPAPQPTLQQQDAESLFLCAEYYANNIGANQDHAQAARFYHQAAVQRHAQAQNKLGDCYYYALGVAEDNAQAAYWYTQATQEGCAEAYFNLGYLYENGHGVEQDYAQAARLYNMAATNGVKDAQHNLALLYLKGQGVPKDQESAVYWYTQAADAGHPRAQYELGCMYKIGHGVPRDFGKSLRYLQPAAEQGLPEAQYELGCMYREGQGVAQNDAQAVYYYRLAAEQGYARAQSNLVFMYTNGYGVIPDATKATYWRNKSLQIKARRPQHTPPAATAEESAAQDGIALFNTACQYYNNQDYRQAVPLLLQAAEQELADAQYLLGLCYDNGSGVPQNSTHAFSWYGKAAQQGHAPAQFRLGQFYAAGTVIQQNFSLAAHWYKLAAEQGLADAQYHLGSLYETGNGVPQNLRTAARWYELAANQDHVLAQFNLAYLYENGNDISHTHSYQAAARWYSQAAQLNHAASQCNLGLLYENGCGVPQDYTQAVFWYRKSAAQGFPRAQYLLGRCYENGHGKSKDKKLAREWYQKAAAQGHEKAKAALKRLTSFFGKLFG